MKALIVTARGFHAGYLGCYGNVWINTPGLDRLAAQGVVFDQHLADVPDPQAAARAWRTGRYQIPSLDGAPVSLPTADLLQLLRDQQIPTYLVVDRACPADPAWRAGWHKVRDDATGLDPCLDALGDCLDEVEQFPHWLIWLDVATLLPPWQIPEQYLEPYFDENAEEDEPDEDDDEYEEDDEDVEPDAEEEEDEEEVSAGDADDFTPPEPLEPWLDPPIGPVDPKDDDAFLRLAHTYAAAVSYFDSAIELLLAELKVRDLLKECLLIVTSDHGQALGEHGMIGPHRPWLHDEVVHLPLLVRLPGTHTMNSMRIPALTQSIDLLPTLLDAFGLERPPTVQGLSLLPLATEQQESIRATACAGWSVAGGVEWLLRTPEWALLDPVRLIESDPPRAVQFYAKPVDRWEVNDLQQHHLEWVDRLRQALEAFVTQISTSTEVPQLILPAQENEEETPAS